MTGHRGGGSTLVVVVHPEPTSFTHAMAAAATRGLERAGRTVTTLDLYAM
ncbi:MAG: Flavodoxin-like fold, partial [Ilumatobacteraceae bacterium]|nr:Flavodoxin-like fold [Ilumatobacteraceae bacterium]